MNFETIIYEKRDSILEITLNRPKRLNALNRKASEELASAIDQAAKDNDIKVLILSGKGRSFCTGADLGEIDFNSFEEAEDFLKRVHDLFSKIENIQKPSIAAINGPALGGGCELALVCDIRIASEASEIGVPEIKMGFLPGGGGTQRLPRLIGIGSALEMIFSGEPVNAHEAHRIGLVNRVVPHESLQDEAMKMAKVLASRSPLALKMAKKVVKNGINMDLKSALEFEIQCISYLSSYAITQTRSG